MDCAPDALNVDLLDFQSNVRELGLETALALLDRLELPQLVSTVMHKCKYVVLPFLENFEVVLVSLNQIAVTTVVLCRGSYELPNC